jgi:Flp pilus assembly pilin Flp
MAYLRELRTRIGGRLRASERGASLIEYALLLALIAMVSIAALTTLGGLVGDQMEEGGNGISGVTATTAAEFQCRPGHEHHRHCREEVRP